MIKSIRAALLLPALLAAGAALAQVSTATAEELMRLSGLWEQVEHIGPQVLAGVGAAVADRGGKPSVAEQERMAAAVRDAYAPARLRGAMQAVLARQLQPARVATVRRWLDSPLGRSITKLEEAASAAGADSQAAVQEGLRQLESMPAERRERLADLLVATRSAEALVQVTLNTALAAARGAASVLPGPAPSLADLGEALEAQRPQMLEGFRALMLVSFATTYATLTPAQLREYTEFMQSDAGRHFNDVAIEALDQALTEAAGELGRRLPLTGEKANT